MQHVRLSEYHREHGAGQEPKRTQRDTGGVGGVSGGKASSALSTTVATLSAGLPFRTPRRSKIGWESLAKKWSQERSFIYGVWSAALISPMPAVTAVESVASASASNQDPVVRPCMTNTTRPPMMVSTP